MKSKKNSKKCHVPDNDNVDVSTNNSINPFDNDILEHLTYREKIQIAFMSVTLAPIRAILLIVFFAFLWPIGAFLSNGRTVEEKSKPLSGWRKACLPVAKFLSRCVFWSAGYQWITITGELDPKARILVFAPHTGFFDSMLITYLNFVSVIGRKGTEKIPLFGHLTNLCQPIIVERENKDSREAAVQNIIERVNSDLDWPPLSIFVEGTTTNGKVLIKFKTGAFKPGVPVQPVCFKYNKQIMDTSSWTWDGPHWFVISWLALCQIHSPIEFEFLPVYYPNEEEKVNSELFAENVRRRMAQCLDVPITDFSYEDAKVTRIARGVGLPSHSGLLDISDMKKKTGVKNVDEFYSCFPLFAKIANLKSGLCFCDQFSVGLGLAVNENIHRYFNKIDKEKNGNFNLRMFTEFYFMNIHNQKNTLLEKVINLFQKFNSSTCENYYSVLEFKMFVKNTFDLEFLNSSLIELNRENIDKETLIQYFNKNILVLYLFSITAKKH